MTSQAEALPLGQMRTECALAQNFVAELDRNEFLADLKTQRAVTMTFVIMAELADRLRLNDPAFTARFPDLPLAEIRGMRNRIVHGYFYVDQSVIWDTVKTAIPALIIALADHSAS